MTVTLRQAVDADMAGVARVNVDTWRSSYGGLIPYYVLNALDYQQQEASWRLNLPHRQILVAEQADAVIGFISASKSRAPELGYSGEVTAFYLLKEHQGLGIGKLMFNNMKAQLKEQGYGSLHLWVLAGNPAIHFYAAMGGHKFTEKTIEIGDKPILEHGYGWPQL